jgi:hypothetical protein
MVVDIDGRGDMGPDAGQGGGEHGIESAPEQGSGVVDAAATQPKRPD